MAARRIRWGLMSTAHINEKLIPAIRATEHSELLAVASRSEERAWRYAREWAIPRAYGSYEHMLADADIDAVYISLPNALHTEWSVRAAEAGKHILCEKPLALTTSDVDKMTQAAKVNGVLLQEAFMYRFHPQTHKVKELLAEGAIGRLRFIRSTFSFNLNRPGDVRLNPELGGGALWDVGCYPVSFARSMVGSEPVEVFGWQTIGDTGVDLSFVGQMRYANGICAQFDCSFEVAHRRGAELVGDRGVLHISDPWMTGGVVEKARASLIRDDGEEMLTFPEGNAYQCEVEDMVQAILTGGEPSLPLADSRTNVATLAALYRSAREGRPARP